MFRQGMIDGAVATARVLGGLMIVAVGLWFGGSVIMDCGNIDCTESVSTVQAMFGVVFGIAAIALGVSVVIWPTLKSTLQASRRNSSISRGAPRR